MSFVSFEYLLQRKAVSGGGCQHSSHGSQSIVSNIIFNISREEWMQDLCFT